MSEQKFQVINFGRTEIGTPKVSEIYGRDPWVKFGEANDFPQELIRLYQNADGLHSAIIRRKVDMIAGLGFLDSLPLNGFIKNQYAKEDLNSVAYDCAFNLVLFGGFYLNVVWDANGQSIAKIYSIPYEKVRAEKPTREDGEVSNWYISRDWLDCKKKENKPYLIANFDLEDEEKRIQEPSQLLFVKVKSPGMDVYSLPSYQPIINWLKVSFEISSYHIRNAQNSYNPGLIVSFPHLPDADQREQAVRDLKQRGGALTAGEPVALFAESKDSLPEFTIVQPSNSDQKYNTLIETVNQQIYIGHTCNNVVAGVAVAGKLGNTSEVKEQFTQFQYTVIAQLQKKVEDTFNKLASINGLPEELKLNQYDTYINNIESKPTVTPTETVGEQPEPKPEEPNEL